MCASGPPLLSLPRVGFGVSLLLLFSVLTLFLAARRGSVYKFVYAHTSLGVWYERLMMILIIGNVSGFIVGSTDWATKDPQIDGFLEGLEKVSVGIFTFDYILRFIAVGEVPRYQGLSGRLSYLFTFYSIVDLAAVLPFYLAMVTPMGGINTSFIRALRLLRMLKMESYMKAFTVFDDILYNNKDVLKVAGFAALVLWIFFSSIMFSPDSKRLPPLQCLHFCLASFFSHGLFLFLPGPLSRCAQASPRERQPRHDLSSRRELLPLHSRRHVAHFTQPLWRSAPRRLHPCRQGSLSLALPRSLSLPPNLPGHLLGVRATRTG